SHPGTPMRKPTPVRLEPLEPVVAPAVFTATIDPAAANAGAVAEVVGLVAKANASPEADTVQLFPGTYTFGAPDNATDVATALPLVTGTGGTATDLTVDGGGATLRRADGSANFRFFEVHG